MEFEQACSEMDYILKHMNPNDLNKIPKDVINFFKENKSVFYNVKLDSTKKLYEQDLKDETKAFIKILNEKYFCVNEETKELDNIIRNEETSAEVYSAKNEIIVYRENILTRIFIKILNFFKIKK